MSIYIYIYIYIYQPTVVPVHGLACDATPHLLGGVVQLVHDG